MMILLVILIESIGLIGSCWSTDRLAVFVVDRTTTTIGVLVQG